MRFEELFALDEGFPMGVEELLSEGPLSAEEEGRILAKIMEKAGLTLPNKKEKKPAKKTRFALVLFAAVLALGTVAASAAAYLQPDGVIAGMLGVGPEGWPEFLRRNGAAAGISQECDGWTLSVDQTVGDGSCAYVLLGLTAPEGVVLDAEKYNLDCELNFRGINAWGTNGWSMVSGMVKDEDKTDNRISFLLEITGGGGLLPAVTGHLEVFSLDEVIDHGPGVDQDYIPYPDGPKWSLDIPLWFKNRRVVYRPRETLEVEGGTVKVTKVEITTLSATVKLTSKDGGLGRWEVGDNIRPLPLLAEMRLLDQDGDPIPVASWGSSGSGVEGITTKMVHTMMFQPVIDPDRVAALSIGGMVIPLK